MTRFRLNFLVCFSLMAASLVWAQDKAAQPTSVQTAYSDSTPYFPRESAEIKDEKVGKKYKTALASIPEASPTSGHGTLIFPVSVYAGTNFVSGINASEVEVFIDGKPTYITAFEVKKEPLNVVLMVDMSPSAAFQPEAVKKLAANLVDRLAVDDKVMVIAFSQKTKFAVELTADRTLIKKGIDRLKMDDGTAIYNAVAEVFEKKLNSFTGNTTLILITDGVDTVSRKEGYRSSLVIAEKGNATIFPIYLDTYAANVKAQGVNTPFGYLSLPSGVNLMGANKEEYALGRLYLTDMAQLSGGHSLFANEPLAGNMVDVDKILSEAHDRYYLSFRPLEGGKSGDRHQIKVRVKKPGLTVLTKGSYIDH